MKLLIDPVSDHPAGFVIKCCEIQGSLKIGLRSTQTEDFVFVDPLRLDRVHATTERDASVDTLSNRRAVAAEASPPAQIDRDFAWHS